jgi:Zn-finger nucleic acid-binding protein
MTIICPYCLGIAEVAKWSKDVEIHECTNCVMIWEAAHYMKLWNKQQIEGARESNGHRGKVFED